MDSLNWLTVKCSKQGARLEHREATRIGSDDDDDVVDVFERIIGRVALGRSKWVSRFS